MRCPNPNCKKYMTPVKVGTLKGRELYACPRCGMAVQIVSR